MEKCVVGTSSSTTNPQLFTHLRLNFKRKFLSSSVIVFQSASSTLFFNPQKKNRFEFQSNSTDDLRLIAILDILSKINCRIQIEKKPFNKHICFDIETIVRINYHKMYIHVFKIEYQNCDEINQRVTKSKVFKYLDVR